MKWLCLCCVLMLTAAAARADEAGLTTLRGDVPLKAADQPPAINKLERDGPPVPRNYRQQPPLIPHSIKNYQLDNRHNRCKFCHDSGNHKVFGAPKLSASHYRDRDGKELGRLSPRRYFCTQCHVPQMDLEPLVDNLFESDSAWAEERGGRR